MCVGLCWLDPSLKVLQLSAAMVMSSLGRCKDPYTQSITNDTSNSRVGFLMSSSYASVYGKGALWVGSGKEGRCFSEIYWTNYGRTLIQADSRRSLTEDRVRSQANLCEICSGQNSIGTCLILNTTVCPRPYHSTNVPYSYIVIYHRHYITLATNSEVN